MRCEHNLYFLWDRFKHISDSQFLEIVITSEEMMPFHDHSIVVSDLGSVVTNNPGLFIIFILYHC